MIWRHLATVVWLQERLRRNQGRRTPVAALLARILRVLTVAAGALMFAVFLAIGALALGGSPPLTLLLAWDGLVLAFLLFWTIGLMAQLQRAELLSAERFLAFPVPPRAVFVINYLGSGVLTADVIIFGSAMVGLAVGLVVSRGAGMLLLLPLVAGFLLLVTAASHQLQGWLAALMANRRRRRHLLAMGTTLVIAFVLAMSQAGPLSERIIAGRAGVDAAEISELRRDLRRLGQAHRAGTITADDQAQETAAIRARLDPLTAAVAAERRELQRRVAIPAHRWIPFGWLPYGAMTLTEGRFMPAVLGALGLVLLGAASLARSYRTTMHLYLGAGSDVRPRAAAVGGQADAPAAAVARSARAPARSGPGMLAWRVPLLSEHAAAIFLASLRSLTRAPEARLMLLSPLIMVIVFGGMFVRRGGTLLAGDGASHFMQPLVALGLFFMVLLTMTQIAGNQFGFDRDGFRVFVLGSASRKHVLLGKNLALMPLALGLGIAALVALQVLRPMRADHFVATLAQTLSIYLVYCLVANLLSIYAPVAIKPGTMKPVRTNATLILANLAVLFVFPLALAPTLLPLGVEAAFAWADVRDLPLYLVLSVVQAAVVSLLYWRALAWQGDLLQAREQRILEVVTVAAE